MQTVNDSVSPRSVMLQWEEQDRSSQYLDVELVIQVVVCTAGAKEDFIPSAS